MNGGGAGPLAVVGSSVAKAWGTCPHPLEFDARKILQPFLSVLIGLSRTYSSTDCCYCGRLSVASFMGAGGGSADPPRIVKCAVAGMPRDKGML